MWWQNFNDERQIFIKIATQHNFTPKNGVTFLCYVENRNGSLLNAAIEVVSYCAVNALTKSKRKVSKQLLQPVHSLTKPICFQNQFNTNNFLCANEGWLIQMRTLILENNSSCSKITFCIFSTLFILTFRAYLRDFYNFKYKSHEKKAEFPWFVRYNSDVHVGNMVIGQLVYKVANKLEILCTVLNRKNHGLHGKMYIRIDPE